MVVEEFLSSLGVVCEVIPEPVESVVVGELLLTVLVTEVEGLLVFEITSGVVPDVVESVVVDELLLAVLVTEVD